MASHETASAQFLELVNTRVSQGRDYTDAWTFVRRNNPELYQRMSTEGAPKVSLGNAANAPEIERLRAVVKYSSKQIVDAANAMMATHAYAFEKAWAETKRTHREIHERMTDANKRALALANAGADLTPDEKQIAANQKARDQGLSFGGDETIQAFSPFGFDRLTGAELAKVLNDAEKSGDRAPFQEFFIAHVLANLKLRGPAGAWAAWDAAFQEVQSKNLPLFKRATGTPTT